MNKETFLKELEKKLKVITKSEKQDIIDEYRDIIDEKVKHGKTEEEAVKEFGDINKLAEEILSAYKIDPEYSKPKESKSKTIIDDCEKVIKEGAKKLGEVTDEVVEGFKNSNFELTTENIFEIIIKVILVLLGLAILKLPFYIISEIGSRIFSIGFSPFNDMTSFVWKLLVEIIYIIICILIIITVISKYTKSSSDKKVNKKNEKVEKRNLKEEKNEVKTTQSKKVKKKVTEDTFGNFLLIICKIFVVLFIFSPMFMVIAFLTVILICVIYFIIKGIYIVGFLLLLLGIIGILIILFNFIYNLLFKNKKICLWSLLVNFILILLGFIMSIDYLFSLEYYDLLPKNLNYETIRYEEKIEDYTFIPNIDEVVIDNNLVDNQVVIEVGYYSEYFSVEKETYSDLEESYIGFQMYTADNGINVAKKTGTLFINNLKDKKIYNYSLLDEINIKVYVNEKTEGLIERY